MRRLCFYLGAATGMCISEILPNISAHTGSSRFFCSCRSKSHSCRPCAGTRGSWWPPGPPGRTSRGVAVRPGVHACRQVAVLLGDAVQHPVDHGHSLGTGDVGIRAEGAVVEAFDPPKLGGARDILLRPMPINVGESLRIAALAGVKPGANGGKLSPRDGASGSKVVPL